MKKFLCFLSGMTLLLTCACRREQKAIVPSSYTIYQQLYELETDFKPFSFPSYHEAGISVPAEKRYVNQNCLQTKKLSLSDSAVSLTYENSIQRYENTASGVSGRYEKYDVYTTEYGDQYEFFDSSNILCFLHRQKKNINQSGKKITESEAKQVADAFLSEVVSAEYLTRYQYCNTNVGYHNDYMVIYESFVHNYRTEDSLCVWVTQNGIISGYNAYNVYRFFSLEDTISETQLEAAHAQLKQAVRELSLEEAYTDCGDPYLLMNRDGAPYLAMPVFYDSQQQNPSKAAAVLYVNVL